MTNAYGENVFYYQINYHKIPNRSISGDQKKFKMVSEYEGLQRIYDLLPSGIQENLMIFGTTLGRIGKEQCIPEFRNTTELLPPPPDLKEEIYKEFEVGEIFVEGASVVKERLQKVQYKDRYRP